MAPFGILAIQAGNGGQGIDEKSVTVHKSVQSCFITDGSIGSWVFLKICCSSSISGSISGNFGDLSQLKFNLAYVKHYYIYIYSNFEPIPPVDLHWFFEISI